MCDRYLIGPMSLGCLKRDSALSKMSCCMKTCKQLDHEKEMMLNSIGTSIAVCSNGNHCTVHSWLADIVSLPLFAR